MKVIFICQANINRSPSFELWFKRDFPKHEVRSAGVMYGYPYMVNKQMENETLAWADVIFIMDLEQHASLKEHFPNHLHKVKMIGLSDQYQREGIQMEFMYRHWRDNIFKMQFMGAI